MARALAVAVAVLKHKEDDVSIVSVCDWGSAYLLARDVVADARNGVAGARGKAGDKVANGARLVLEAARDGVALDEAVGVVVEAVKGVRLRARQEWVSISTTLANEFICML